ncbi:MAG TPA: glycosyltransferase family 1 protein [Clostridiaceae bacterium]
MKIGIDGRASQWYRGTGIGTYSYQLINSIRTTDKENDYLLFMSKDRREDISLSENISINEITKNIDNNFWDEVNMPNILKNKEIDLYHVPQNGIGLPKEKNCSFVITLHDVIPFKMPETVGEKYLKIFLEEVPKIIPLCDGIITVSNFSKNDIAETFNYPKEKIHVTYLASEDIYHPLNKEKCKSFIKENYSIAPNFLLYIGGFSPRKNILGLIEAFSKVNQTFDKELKLVIVGKLGKSYDIYKERAEKLGVADSVIFTGFIPITDLPYFYNACEIFVYPSFYEGFGLPPIEAMACGTPVITSSITSIPEVVENAAILIDPHDINALSESIIMCLSDSDLRKTLIQRGLLKTSKLSWKETAKQTVEIYKKIMS